MFISKHNQQSRNGIRFDLFFTRRRKVDDPFCLRWPLGTFEVGSPSLCICRLLWEVWWRWLLGPRWSFVRPFRVAADVYNGSITFFFPLFQIFRSLLLMMYFLANSSLSRSEYVAVRLIVIVMVERLFWKKINKNHYGSWKVFDEMTLWRLDM